MRGLTVNALTASEAEGNDNGGTVATYLGEIPVTSTSQLATSNASEVLRGPQGTLFGAGSLAGAVRYIVRKPDTEEFSAEVHGRGYGIESSDGVSYDVDGTINIPLGDRLAFRGTLSYLDQQGFIDPELPGAGAGRCRFPSRTSATRPRSMPTCARRRTPTGTSAPMPAHRCCGT